MGKEAKPDGAPAVAVRSITRQSANGSKAWRAAETRFLSQCVRALQVSAEQCLHCIFTTAEEEKWCHHADEHGRSATVFIKIKNYQNESIGASFLES